MNVEERYAAVRREKEPWAPDIAKLFVTFCALMDEWPLQARGAWKFRRRA